MGPGEGQESDLGSRIQGLGFRVWGLGFSGSGFGGLGFRVYIRLDKAI